MLWKTHLRISNEALRRLNINLSKEIHTKFREGNLVPDQWKDYPHHYGKTNAIEQNLLKARQCFLQDNHKDAFFYLGVTLHYIQDAYTSVISYNSPNNQEWHHNYEQSIEDSDFVCSIENTIHYCFHDNIHQLNNYSHIACELSKEVQGKQDTLRLATLVGKVQSQQTGNPKVDLNLALMACTKVVKSVAGPKNNSMLDSTIWKFFNEHQNLLQESEKQCSNDIINCAMQIENLKSKKGLTHGLLTKLKNVILEFRIRIKSYQLNHKYTDYSRQRHLLKVNLIYQNGISTIVNPHVGWYNYLVPKLNFQAVRKELVPINQINENREIVNRLVSSGKISSFRIGNQKIVLRKDLTKLV